MLQQPDRAGGVQPLSAPASVAAPSVGREKLMLAGILLVTALAYLRCLGNSFVFDDLEMIVLNPRLGQWSFFWKSVIYDSWWFRDPSHLPQGPYYRPLQDIWFALNYHLFGLNSAGWHATMVALHLLNVWLVARIARRLTEDWQTALLAALLFGVLPLQVEAVAWASSIPHELSTAFELAAFYLIMARTGASLWNWTLALLSYAGALLSHESAVVFPGLVASYVFLLDATGSGLASLTQWQAAIWPRVHRALLCVAALALELLLYVCLRRLALGFLITNPANPTESAAGGQFLMTVPLVLTYYLALLAIPWMAGPSHRVFFVTSPTSPDFYLPLALLVVLAAAFFLALRNRPRVRLYTFCVLWIGIALAPAMSLFMFPRDELVYDHYAHLAIVGWCVLVADWVVRFARKGRRTETFTWAGVAVVVLMNLALLWHAERFWHDDVTLYQRCVTNFPESWHCHYNLGLTFEALGDSVDAERELQASLRVRPDFAPARYSLGLVHAHLGRTAEATREIAGSLDRMQGSVAKGYVALAELYQAQGNPTAAEHELDKAASLYPEDGEVFYSLGLLHEHLGRVGEAVNEIGKALKLMSHPPALAFVNLAELYDAQGEQARSEGLLQQVESMPGGGEEAALSRARIRAEHGDRTGTEKILRELAGRYPNDRRIWTMLGLLLADQNRNQEALAAYQRALSLAPGDAQPHLFAARVLHATGRDREAADQCRQALAIEPGNPEARALMAQLSGGAGAR